MQEVEAVCDRVIIINKGEIVANDTTETLQKNTTKQIITVEFDKEVSINTLKSITGVEDAILIDGKTWKVISDLQNDVRKELFNYAVKHNLSVLTMNKEEQKLEDIFKALTKK
jgi:ABC-2 type transport system ATP-binding protein